MLVPDVTRREQASPPLSDAERAVALALYRHGGGTLDVDAFTVALAHDPLAQRVARKVTPIVGRAVRDLTELLFATASGQAACSSRRTLADDVATGLHDRPHP